MTNVLYPPPRPQSVGEILDSAFRIFRATLVKCLPYAVAALILGQLPEIYYVATGHSVLELHDAVGSELGAFWYYLATGRTPELPATIRDPIWWVLFVLAYLIVIVLWGAILLRQYAITTGHPVALREELAMPLRLVPGVLLIFIVTIVAIHVCVLPVLAFHGAARLGLLVLLAIPASCIAVALSCSWPALLLTSKSWAASLQYSWRLTSGSWMRLMLIYTVAFVLLIVFYLIVGVVIGLVAVVIARGDLASTAAITAALVALLGVLVLPLGWALMLAVFGDLSVRKEGADLAQRLTTPAAP